MKKRITHFGSRKAILGRTPSWANNIIAIIVITCGIIHYVIMKDDAIDTTLANRIGIYLNAVEMLVVALFRLFGVAEENLTKNPANGPDTDFTDIS
jgi:hypothetical protein